MKRKAPETLLEFSEYILPLKRMKVVHPEPEANPLQFQVFYEESPREEIHYDYAPIYKTRSDEESDTTEWPFGSRSDLSLTRPSSIVQDFYIDTILSDNLLAKKPFGCKEPIHGFVEAIKWLIENKKLIQREVAYELDVSPSTLSLYLNKTKRNHGWRELEVKIDEWLRAQLSA